MVKPALKPRYKVHEVEAPEDYKNDIKAFSNTTAAGNGERE